MPFHYRENLMMTPLRIATIALLAVALGACATPDYKAQSEARDGIARAQPIIDKLIAHKAKRGLFPIALSDIGELGQDSYYYQPSLGGDSYVLSFDYSLMPQTIRCTRTLERDWICVRK
jgi:hypothetical protein